MPTTARVGDMHTCPMVTSGMPTVPNLGDRRMMRILL
jgi:hypothetical protein